ncbi:MAG: leucyl/phenylalanyl-tRNA--protein transferase, partial [Hyphomicrobiaceae bacterium]
MAAKLRQLALGVAYDFKPPRHLALPHLAWRLARHTFASRSERGRLPEASAALPGREGVAGYCDDMSVSTLRAAYLQGLYPCTHWGPVRWQSPPLRAVLAIGELKLRDELRRKLRKRPFVVTFDTAPRAVMLACAQPRSGQWPLTWITADVVDAYMAAFDEGMVHSVEVWDGDGRLIGGLFGTVAGTCCVLESLFHTANNASKYGLAVLLGHLHAWG